MIHGFDSDVDAAEALGKKSGSSYVHLPFSKAENWGLDGRLFNTPEFYSHASIQFDVPVIQTRISKVK